MIEPARLLLKNAHLITAGVTFAADVAVERGRIQWIGRHGERPERASHQRRQRDRVIDVGGRWLLPGLIDSHVHFREPGGHSHKGTYASESRAAAAGGVTSVLTMPNTDPFTSTRDVLEQVRHCASRSVVDYGFHFHVAADNLAELAAVRNVAAFKLYMNETTGISSPLCDEEVLRRVMALGHPLSAHAEGDTLDFLLDVHQRHGVGPLYIVHVCLAREVQSLRRAKAAGQWVYAEATPHHLFLTDEDAARLGPFGDMRPTLKSAADVAALWDGIADGTIDTIATDHAPHLREEKEACPAPPGVPGLQTMLPLLLTAVDEGRLTPRHLVRLTSQRPAEIFGLRRKGVVAVGADADFVVVDPTRAASITDEEQLTHPGWTPFAGWRVTGGVDLTIRRGQVIYESGEVTAKAGGAEIPTRDPGAWQDGVSPGP